MHFFGEPAVFQMARLPWALVSGHTIRLAAVQSIQARRLASNSSQGFQSLARQFLSMDVMAFAKLFKIVTLAQDVEIVAKLSVFQIREI